MFRLITPTDPEGVEPNDVSVAHAEAGQKYWQLTHDYPSEQLPVCTLSQFPMLREALLPHKDRLRGTLWQVAEEEQWDARQRFQAAAALAKYAPNDERWQAIAPFVSQHLTTAVSPVYLGQWSGLFQPASQELADSLIAIHADRSRSEKTARTSGLPAFGISAQPAVQADGSYSGRR